MMKLQGLKFCFNPFIGSLPCRIRRCHITSSRACPTSSPHTPFTILYLSMFLEKLGCWNPPETTCCFLPLAWFFSSAQNDSPLHLVTCTHSFRLDQNLSSSLRLDALLHFMACKHPLLNLEHIIL